MAELFPDIGCAHHVVGGGGGGFPIAASVAVRLPALGIEPATLARLGMALVLSALPLGLRAINVLDQLTADNKFSSEAYFNQTLSSLNIHANPALPLDEYLKKAAEALPSPIRGELRSP